MNFWPTITFLKQRKQKAITYASIVKELFKKKILWRTQVLFVGPLITMFWTSGDVCPGFQKPGWIPFCVLCYLHAMDSSDSPLVRHLLTSDGQHGSQSRYLHACSRGRMPLKNLSFQLCYICCHYWKNNSLCLFIEISNNNEQMSWQILPLTFV